jgi:hypothetical protein
MEATEWDVRVCTVPLTIALPIGLYNSRDRSTDCPAFDHPIQARIPPFSQRQEEVVIHSLLSELNDNYSVEPAFTETGTVRTVFSGSSHMNDITNDLTAAGKDIIDLSACGWHPNRASINKLASSIATLKLYKSNAIYLDLCSNIHYMGSDSDGIPVVTEKSLVDGKYHLRGEPQAAPRQVFCRILKDCFPILETAAATTIVLMAPTPRYVKTGYATIRPINVSNID